MTDTWKGPDWPGFIVPTPIIQADISNILFRLLMFAPTAREMFKKEMFARLMLFNF